MFRLQQSDFTIYPSGISCQAPIAPHHPVARYYYAYRIVPHGTAYRLRRHSSHSPMPGYIQSYILIGNGLAIRYGFQYLPHGKTERRAGQMQFRHKTGLATAEITIEPLGRTFEYRQHLTPIVG